MNIVQELRLNAGLTRDLLAKLSGVSASSIARYEAHTGHPTLAVLARLADAAELDAVVSFVPIFPGQGRPAFACRLNGDVNQSSRRRRRRPDSARGYALCRLPIVSMTSFGAMWARWVFVVASEE